MKELQWESYMDSSVLVLMMTYSGDGDGDGDGDVRRCWSDSKYREHVASSSGKGKIVLQKHEIGWTGSQKIIIILSWFKRNTMYHSDYNDDGVYDDGNDNYVHQALLGGNHCHGSGPDPFYLVYSCNKHSMIIL